MTALNLKPGIYSPENLPIEAYHSQCCAGPSVSSSGLRTILFECPAKFFATSDLNPDRFPEETSDALNIGRAAHALVLGEPEFAKHFVVSPYDDFRTKEARAWRDDEPRQVIKAADFETIKAMADAQRRSEQVAHAFTEGKPEFSLIWRDAETGIYLKTRPDWFPDKPKERFVVEYKSAISIEPRRLSADAFKYGYHLQAAMVLDGIKAVLKLDPLGVGHVAQEKDPPYLADLRVFSPEQIDFGRLLYRRALRTFARCLKEKSWPGYTTEPQYFETPYYVAKQMENADDDDGHDGTRRSDRKHTAEEYLAAG